LVHGRSPEATAVGPLPRDGLHAQAEHVAVADLLLAERTIGVQLAPRRLVVQDELEPAALVVVRQVEPAADRGGELPDGNVVEFVRKCP